jgi:hypothetical protein
MEHCGGKQALAVATHETRKWPEQAKFVAVGCHWLPRVQNGKEGVDGSSPSEGSKIPGNRGFLLSELVQSSTSLVGRGSAVE